jgi:hypothetical protein
VNRKIGYWVGVSSLVLTAGGLLVSPAAYSQSEHRTDRQEARDTKQTGREAARDVKAACREGDEKGRPECRQEKRDVKQGAHDAARDIKKND